jgi:rod shape-determining protein MreC
MQQTLLMARLQKLSSLKVENIRLRELLKSSKKVNENVLIGELLAVDLEPFTRKITINKGSRENIYLGQPLIDANGVMGQTIHVNPFTSTAMLITDPNHAIPVQVNRNGLRAIAIGNGSPDVLEIPYLPNSADIVEGDLLTSSGLGGRFPPDYPVAIVNYVFKDASKPYAVVTATPTAHLETSREVLLVWTEEPTNKDDDDDDKEAATEQKPNTSSNVPRPPAHL